MDLFFLGILIIASAAMLSFFLREEHKAWLMMLGMSGGCITIMVQAAAVLWSGKVLTLTVVSGYPLGNIDFEINPFSAFFLMVIGIGAVFGSIFTAGYIKSYLGHGRTIATHFVFMAVMVSAMLVLVTVRNVLAFLIIWEIMSLSSFFLISLENEKKEVFSAALNYLVMMHVSVVFLLIGFILLIESSKGSLDFGDIAAAMSACSPGRRDLIFVLLLAGFGIKAGMVPFHSWMPLVYPEAPNHVAAIMSGVMSKMGIFGILLTLLLIGMPSAWVGYAVLTVGGVSALTGIVYALAQTDIKRIVAYSSVENIGIIFMGIGCGMLGGAYNYPVVMFCGFGGALFHVFNHSLFKGLMFYSTGVICRQVNTRNIEQLGGLAKRMPKAAVAALTGSLAISALPPFNGFVSEFLIYIGLLSCMKGHHTLLITMTALAIMTLALTGALALICFTRFAGIIYLGHPRGEAAANAVEPPWVMLLPMAAGAIGCLAAGLCAMPVLTLLSNIVGNFKGVTLPADVETLLSDSSAWVFCDVPAIAVDALSWTFWVFLVFGGMVMALLVLRRLLLSRRDVLLRGTWGCGYDLPTSRIQYTGVSYSLPLIKIIYKLFKNEVSQSEVKGIYPVSGVYSYKPGDLFNTMLVMPLKELVHSFMGRFTWIQNGNIQYYILYGIIFLALMIVWGFLR